MDPRFEVRFDAGAPTVPHLNAAAGSLWLNVDPSHWLYVASGGDMPACPLHAGRFRVASIDMLHAAEMLRVVCNFDSRLVVHLE